jgi:hypothetical protein
MVGLNNCGADSREVLPPYRDALRCQDDRVVEPAFDSKWNMDNRSEAELGEANAEWTMISFSVHFFACPKKRTKEKASPVKAFIMH